MIETSKSITLEIPKSLLIPDPIQLTAPTPLKTVTRSGGITSAINPAALKKQAPSKKSKKKNKEYDTSDTEKDSLLSDDY